jgi:hypothetical protein
VCLCIPLSLLGNGSVNTFPRQTGIVGGVVFYKIGVVSKESRRLVLPRTSSNSIIQSSSPSLFGSHFNLWIPYRPSSYSLSYVIVGKIEIPTPLWALPSVLCVSTRVHVPNYVSHPKQNKTDVQAELRKPTFLLHRFWILYITITVFLRAWTCWIWGSHSEDYEAFDLLECNAL